MYQSWSQGRPSSICCSSLCLTTCSQPVLHSGRVREESGKRYRGRQVGRGEGEGEGEVQGDKLHVCKYTVLEQVR